MFTKPPYDGVTDTPNRRTVSRTMQTVDAALLERSGQQQLHAHAATIASAFLKAFHQARLQQVRHQLLTFPVTQRYGVHYHRLCSCGFMSVACSSAALADVLCCPVYEAEFTRAVRARSHNADRVIEALLNLSVGA